MVEMANATLCSTRKRVASGPYRTARYPSAKNRTVRAMLIAARNARNGMPSAPAASTNSLNGVGGGKSAAIINVTNPFRSIQW